MYVDGEMKRAVRYLWRLGAGRLLVLMTVTKDRPKYYTFMDDYSKVYTSAEIQPIITSHCLEMSQLKART